MHVISIVPLRVFWQKHSTSEEPLKAWYRTLEKAEFSNFSELKEAFAAYDKVGTEGTTICSTPPSCLSPGPLVEKVMAYVHGADHAEFLNTNTVILGEESSSYLSKADQFCVGKAYISAFLKKHLKNQSAYNGFLRGEWQPYSFKKIKTTKHDGINEPAGSKLRVYNQYSPKAKQSLENVEDGNYSLAYKSEGISLRVHLAGDHFGSEFKVRHLTNALIVSWKEDSRYQYIGFNVPAKYRNAKNFKYLSLRIGQVKAMPFPYANDNRDEKMWVGLKDSGGTVRWVRLDYRGKIPRADRHTAMNTISVPLNEFPGLNLSNVRAVYFAFFPNTHGSIMLDNIEWWYQ